MKRFDGVLVLELLEAESGAVEQFKKKSLVFMRERV
jgi:hypothetical protein